MSSIEEKVMPNERVFLDMKKVDNTYHLPATQRSGYFVRCQQLIEKQGQSLVVFGDHEDRKVVGIVYDGTNTIELILDPPIGDDEDE